MRRIFIVITICISISWSAWAQDCGHKDTVEVLSEFENLFKFQNYYISGQPDKEMLDYLKEKGVTQVINLRGQEEISDFTEEHFNEAAYINSLGINYSVLHIEGASGYTPENLERFSELTDPGQNVLIHCRSGGRATYLFMAYLIEEKGYDINAATRIGSNMKYYFVLEELLGKEVYMEIK